MYFLKADHRAAADTGPRKPLAVARAALVLRPRPGRRRRPGNARAKHDAPPRQAKRDQEGEAVLLAAAPQDLALGRRGRAV